MYRVSLVLVMILCNAITSVAAAALEKKNPLQDKDDRCGEWAEMGECDKNPGFMQSNCVKSCDVTEKARLKELQELNGLSFYDLKAEDIDGNMVDFSSFKNKVVIITNVASFCGYTESHYKGLVELWSNVEGMAVELLAFPCNQFGSQEPGSTAEIKEFASNKGVQFTMMSKINVNGPNASLVYKYLKSKAGPSSISWNFATYFVVDPDGHVESHSGIEPMQLKENVLNMLDREEL